MQSDGGTPAEEVYRYRTVVAMGGQWRVTEWTDHDTMLEKLDEAKDRDADLTSIERKNVDTGDIERQPEPGAEWKHEDETDIQIRGPGDE